MKKHILVFLSLSKPF